MKKFKSPEEIKIQMLERRINNIEKRSFSRKFSQIGHDMNCKFSESIGNENYNDIPEKLEHYFKQFLSSVYEKIHDKKFCGLELRDDLLVLSIDADVIPSTALEIQFALFVFLEEWYSDLGYGNILLEWT